MEKGSSHEVRTRYNFVSIINYPRELSPLPKINATSLVAVLTIPFFKALTNKRLGSI